MYLYKSHIRDNVHSLFFAATPQCGHTAHHEVTLIAVSLPRGVYALSKLAKFMNSPLERSPDASVHCVRHRGLLRLHVFSRGCLGDALAQEAKSEAAGGANVPEAVLDSVDRVDVGETKLFTQAIAPYLSFGGPDTDGSLACRQAYSSVASTRGA